MSATETWMADFKERFEHSDEGFGVELKTRNGIILMPQPSDDPLDPLNWYEMSRYCLWKHD